MTVLVTIHFRVISSTDRYGNESLVDSFALFAPVMNPIRFIRDRKRKKNVTNTATDNKFLFSRDEFKSDYSLLRLATASQFKYKTFALKKKNKFQKFCVGSKPRRVCFEGTQNEFIRP